jgi:hypothetical protein
MVRALLTAALALSVASSVGDGQSRGPGIVLPNHELVQPVGSSCTGIWEEVPKNGNTVYPAQMTLDIRDMSVHSLVARYDASVSISDIQSAINARYGSWALPESPTSTQRLWRVTPERFTISLDVGEGKMKEVYYFRMEGKPDPR